MLSLDQLKENEDILKSLLKLLPRIPRDHAPNSPIYIFLSEIAKKVSFKLFGPGESKTIDLGEYGKLNFPFFSMGAINSTHLFGLDELILFSFYLKNKKKYKKVADLGANIGLHSIILTNLDFDVVSYEPDKIHVAKIKENFALNCAQKKIKVINKAVSTETGETEFIRLKGNSTGSHISGAKENYYGEVERIVVRTDSFKDIIRNYDFLKIDVEGHEADILLTTNNNDWQNTDAMIEVGSQKNSELIYEFFKDIKINLFSQKNSWNKVDGIHDMPRSYKDGSLFISNKKSVPW